MVSSLSASDSSAWRAGFTSDQSPTDTLNRPAQPHPGNPSPSLELANNISSDQLPSYAELKAQEGHRFGRWKGWIEKRARERNLERHQERREAELQGRSFGTGWDLPESSPKGSTNLEAQAGHLDRNPSIISTKNENAAFENASQNYKANRNNHLAGSSPSHPRFKIDSAPGVVNLTPSTSIYNIGSRFLPQFPSQPLCAVPLPMSNHHQQGSEHSIDRFLLVGTIDGLYVCDLIPSLSHTIKTDLVSSTDSKIYQLWQGLGIHQLDIAVEDVQHQPSPSRYASGPNSSAMHGIVIALTSQTTESATIGSSDGLSKSIKMWPLQSLINLVKFRAFSQNSECLDLRARSVSSKRMSALAAGTSAFAGLKSMFEKGKHKAESSASHFFDSALATGASSSSRMDRNGPNDTSLGHPSAAAGKPIGQSPPRDGTAPKFSSVPSIDQSHLEIPLQWAKQTITLELPRIQANGPILFIKLSHSPVAGFNPINDELDRQSTDPLPAGLRSRAHTASHDRDEYTRDTANRLNNGWWYLIIATKQLVFVMESQPSDQRTWHLRAEMAAPFTPKTADLVLSEFRKSNLNHTSTTSVSAHTRSQTISRRSSSSPWVGTGEPSILLTMKEYSAVICLDDLSVREIDLPGTVTTSQSSTGGLHHSAMKKLGSGSLSGLDATLMHLPRSDVGVSVETVLTTKKRDSMFSSVRDDGFLVESRRQSRMLNDRRWIGCEELLLPVPPLRARFNAQANTDVNSRGVKPAPRSVYLVTRGHLTYAVLCPFGLDVRVKNLSKSTSRFEGSNDSPGGVPPPILLKPIHTFTWRAIPLKVQAHIIPKPPQWYQSQEIDDPNGTSPTEGGQHEIFCCLTAFTPSGIEVQEGFISIGYIRAIWERGSSRASSKINGSFFTPASQYRTEENLVNQTEKLTCSPQVIPESLARFSSSPLRSNPLSPHRQSSLSPDQEELSDKSSYDYGTKIGFLCSGKAWFSTGPGPSLLDRQKSDSRNDGSNSSLGDDPYSRTLDRALGSFFWKEAVGEWKIMYVCNGMSL